MSDTKPNMTPNGAKRGSGSERGGCQDKAKATEESKPESCTTPIIEIPPPTKKAATKKPPTQKSIPENKKQSTEEKTKSSDTVKAENSRPSQSETSDMPCAVRRDTGTLENFIKALRMLDVIAEALRETYTKICAVPTDEKIDLKRIYGDDVLEPIENWDISLLTNVCMYIYKCKKYSVDKIPKEKETAEIKTFKELFDFEKKCENIRNARKILVFSSTMTLSDKEYCDFYVSLKNQAKFFGDEKVEKITKIQNEDVDVNSLEFKNFQRIMFQGQKAKNEKRYEDALRYYQQALYISEKNPTGVPINCKAEALDNCSEVSGFVGCKELSDAYKKCHEALLSTTTETKTETQMDIKTEVKTESRISSQKNR